MILKTGTGRLLPVLDHTVFTSCAWLAQMTSSAKVAFNDIIAV
jgi:hypothetical protein